MQACAENSPPSFILPTVRGRYAFNYLLSKMTWFKVGGPVDVLFKPADIDDLVTFIRSKDPEMPLTLLGAGSNVLVRDGGVRGCVIKLGASFADIEFFGENVIVGAACLDRTFVLACGEVGLTGVEFLVGVPGTIGGAIAMNAGAYEFEVKDVLNWVDVLTVEGDMIRLNHSDLSMTYRNGNLPKGAIVLRASFSLQKGDPAIIQSKINDYLQKREDTQPVRGRTGGSTFKNPPGMSAWKLIDGSGCRGMKFNDAQVSIKHCNFLLNLDAAKARDLERLGEYVWQAVKEKTGVELEWEIIRLGE